MSNKCIFMEKEIVSYIEKYNKEKYKMYQFRVKRSDEDIIAYLDAIIRRNSYILSLIEKDRLHSTLTLKEIKSVVKPIMKKYNINEIYLFGSYARGEANPSSDVDIYCEKGNIKTLIDQGKLEDELSNALNKKIDIVFSTSQMNDFFKKQMMEDLIKLC